MKKSVSSAIALAFASAFILVGAPAANAAAPTDLPAGQTLYAIDCDDFGPQLWSVDPSGAATPVGDAHLTATGSACGGGAQVSPVSGIPYFIYYPGGPVTALATIDVTTGVTTTIAALSGATTNAWQLIITNSGAAYVSSSDDLYSIDLGTAVTTFVGSMAPASVDAMGYNPVNDTIYVVEYSNTIAVWTVDRTNGAVTDTGLGGNWAAGSCLAGGTSPSVPDGLVFDSAGFGWIESDSCGEAVVMSVDLSDGSSSATGQLFDTTGTVYTTAPNEFYSETFFIAPQLIAAAPALAATGVDSTATTVAGGVALLATALGLVLIARKRRTA